MKRDIKGEDSGSTGKMDTTGSKKMATSASENGDASVKSEVVVKSEPMDSSSSDQAPTTPGKEKAARVRKGKMVEIVILQNGRLNLGHGLLSVSCEIDRCTIV